MTTPVWVDNVYGTLASGIAATDLSISLTAGHGVRFPVVTGSQVLYATLLNSANVLEQIHITAHTANSDTLTVTRAANGTTGKAWSAGDRIECRLNSEGLSGFATSGSVQNGSVTKLGTVAGTDTITAVMTPTLTAYTSGQYVFMTAAGTNTGATTLNIDGVGATAVKKNSSAGLVALIAGDIQASGDYLFYYDGTQFVLMNPAAMPAASQAQMEATTSNAVAVTPGNMNWHPSVVKARVSFTVAGGVVTITSSVNVASVTRNGAGDYTVNFTTAFSSTAYSWSVNCGQGAGGSGAQFSLAPSGADPAAGAFRFQTLTLSPSTLVDAAFASAEFWGDQ